MQPASSRYVRFLAPLGTLGVGLALFLLPGTRAWFSGALMLFTQRSVQTLQGAIRAADFPFVQSACLSALQTCILPWLLPRQFIASSLCLGPFLGFLTSFLGALAGCALWYGVARLLFLPCPRLPARWKRPLLAAVLPFAAGLPLALLGMGGPVCGLAGALGLPFGPVLTGAALASGLLAAAYGALCTAFSAQLPPPWGTLLRCAGVALTLFAGYRLARKPTP